MKKKILSVIMVATMAISLVACGTSTKDVATTSQVEVETTENDEVVSDIDSEAVTVLADDGVTVDGDIGTAVTLTAKEVNLADYAALNDYLSDKTTGSVAYDITMSDVDGKAVQPAGKVNVTVGTSEVTGEGDNYVVYYADAEGIFERMEVTNVTDDSVTFITTHFSVYVVSKYDDTVVSDTDFAAVSTDVEAKAEEVKTEEITESAESAESTSGTDVADTTPKTPTYTYTDTSATMYAKSSVNVRDLPDTSGNKLGGLSTNDEVKVTGKCNETGWYRIEYKGGTAYVSNSYLVSEKVEVAPPADTSSNGGNNGGGSSGNCPYTLWEAIDNGTSISWYVIQPDPNWNVHASISENIQATIRNRAPNGWFDQTEWTYIGTYNEGKVYRQTFGILDYCPW